jgi:hypothetical protein
MSLREILDVEIQTSNLVPRGGSTLSLLPSRDDSNPLLAAFGGADRNGVQFSVLDVSPVSSSSDITEKSLESKSTTISWKEATRLQKSDTLPVDQLPKLAGHAAVSVWDKLLVFGGINFNEAEVYDKLYEVSIISNEEAASSTASETTTSVPSPSYSYISREILPSGTKPAGRTGHSFVAVPPAIFLPPPPLASTSSTINSSSSDASLSSSIPCHLSTLPSSFHVDDNDSVRIVYLFGGSTPKDGTLNDLFRLRVTRSPVVEGDSLVSLVSNQSPSSPSSFSYNYEWDEIGTIGDTPLPRELHNAFIRPTILQFVHGQPDIESSSLDKNASKTFDPLVNVLQDPLLIIHGGRVEDKDGMPVTARDLAFLNLHSLSWTCLPLASDKSQRFYCASAASCQTKDGLLGFAVGGQDTAEGEICNSLYIYDFRFGVMRNEREESTDVVLPRVPTKQLFETLIKKVQLPENVSSRFAAAATCTTCKCKEGGEIANIYAFGGMAHIEDLSEIVRISVSL